MIVVISFFVGVGGTLLAARVGARGLITAAEERRPDSRGGRNRRRAIEIEAQEDAIDYRRQVEDEIREQRREVTRVERRLEQREEALERRSEGLERSEQSLRDRLEHIDEREQAPVPASASAETEMERLAGMTADEARAHLLERLDGELRDEAARRVRAMETSAKAEADVRAARSWLP